MRNSLRFIVFSAALAASPALAQINVGLGGQAGAGLGVGVGGQPGGPGGAQVGGQAGAGLGAGAGVNPGATVGRATDALGGTVGRVDRTVNGALNSRLRAATSADLTSGATVRDERGGSIGVIQSVSGNVAVVAQNGRMLHVPLSSLYKSGSGIVTNLSSAQLRAAANAGANADARVHH